ncbi:surface protease GP63 [Trypanosoma rangeli]|uniref:Leishmanolysin-like peptidase n=1 Tax=Trypanosoma rangeli TaxID=5698 RepID=A0A422MQ49_TRYRA|nr:surface protease GP63 [Trypanosoma rangeli]RNE95339.1 surface protease GP63 [Trypanosoma rangeli]|eukprot:RNE95339.1 surface protease GP63 [Trypanosoma rangeli]
MLRLLCCALLFVLCGGGGVPVIAVPHRCVFDSLPRNVPGVTPEGEPVSPVRVSVGSDWVPIRIRVFTDNLEAPEGFCSKAGEKINMFLGGQMVCQEEDVLTEEKVEILKSVILPEAAWMHSERLLVRPLNGPLVVPRLPKQSVCAKFEVPEEHHTDGVPDADMVLYAAAVPTLKMTFAWAMPCATLGSSGRPVVGVINYNPRHIVNTSQHIRVAVHEMAHALGFIASDMENMQLVTEVPGVRGMHRAHIVHSANTRKKARVHYGCDSALGMELEYVPQIKRQAAGGQSPRPAVPPPAAAGSLPASGPVIRRVTREEGERETERRIASRGGPRSGLGDHPPGMPSSMGARNGRGRQGNGRISGSPGKQRGAAGTEGVKQQTLKLRGPPLPVLASPQAVAGGNAVPERGREQTSEGTEFMVVEKQWRPPLWLGLNSHWARRNAKDELMANLVVSGYYTALTMAVFADLGYYKVNFEKAEPMRWGSGAGCKLLTEKCVNNGVTSYPEMFCTSLSGTALRCTSDRQSLGSCLLQNVEGIPAEFAYFSTSMGSKPEALMNYCPFIAPTNGTGCVDGIEAAMPGSVVGPTSRCLTGEGLQVGDVAVGDVCVDVRCGKDALSVRYKGSKEWHPCPSGYKLTPTAPFTAGRITCPSFNDVCLTMLQHREAESPPKHHGKGSPRDSSASVVLLVSLLFGLVIGVVLVAP